MFQMFFSEFTFYYLKVESLQLIFKAVHFLMLLRACYTECIDVMHYQSEEALMGIMYLNKLYIYFFV